DALVVALYDGREVSVPLEWFPRLRNATPEQRENWRLIARGVGIHCGMARAIIQERTRTKQRWMFWNTTEKLIKDREIRGST
ncbi:MAG: DUF2442 domain-containing protein, partial [Anaerolineae bacterium]